MAGDIVDSALLSMHDAEFDGSLFVSDAADRDVWLTQSANGCGLAATVSIRGQHLRTVAAFLIRAAERREAQAAVTPAETMPPSTFGLTEAEVTMLTEAR